jgi:hypothetical protein
MRRTISRASLAPVAITLATLLATAGCGNEDTGASEPTDKEPAAAADTSAGEGDWLLGITSAGGADGETSTTTYLTYNPSTGKTTARKLPGVKAGSGTPEGAALLVSTDRRWAIPDPEISGKGEKSGKLEVHALTGGAPTTIDLRKRAGRDDLRPVGWAFDPAEPATLRIVDSANRVWRTEVTGSRATLEDKLPGGAWIFTSGFDYNTGEPWVESISNNATRPKGHGVAEKAVATRAGGTVLAAGSAGFEALPKSPCELGAGFTAGDGLTWAFCADGRSVKTYYLPEGTEEWQAYGEPSAPVAPEASGFPLVLPPAE